MICSGSQINTCTVLRSGELIYNEFNIYFTPTNEVAAVSSQNTIAGPLEPVPSKLISRPFLGCLCDKAISYHLTHLCLIPWPLLSSPPSHATSSTLPLSNFLPVMERTHFPPVRLAHRVALDEHLSLILRSLNLRFCCFCFSSFLLRCTYLSDLSIQFRRTICPQQLG